MQRLHYKHVDALVDKETGLFRKFLSEEMIQPEQWKDVPGYEGYYQVSDKGRVRSLDRWVDNNGGKFFRKGCLIALSQAKGLEWNANFSKEGVTEQIQIDHLLAKAFLSMDETGYGRFSWRDGDPNKHCLQNIQVNATTDERLSSEAALVGLKLLGQGTKKGNRLYRFIGCGHERIIPTGDVREGSFTCRDCYSDRLRTDAEKLGCEIVSNPLEGDSVDLVFKDCKHKKTVLKTDLKLDKIFCQDCKNIRWNEALSKHNLKLLYVKKGQRFVLQLPCGHIGETRSSNALRGSIVCDICQTEKWKQEAANSGLVWLSRADPEVGKKRKGRYLLPCGCEASIGYAAVREGHWKCPSCEKNYLNFPNSLYLYEMRNGDMTWLKLGYAREPSHRKYDYKLSEGTSAELLIVVKTTTGQFALDNENRLHKKYKSWNLCKKKMREYLTESGFTECYSPEIKDLLLNDLKELENV